MLIKNIEENKYVEITDIEKENIAFQMGEEAFTDTVGDTDPFMSGRSIEDVDVVFEYLYLDQPNDHPDKKLNQLSVVLQESDRNQFIAG
jgi:hypothetical protein